MRFARWHRPSLTVLVRTFIDTGADDSEIQLVVQVPAADDRRCGERAHASRRTTTREFAREPGRSSLPKTIVLSRFCISWQEFTSFGQEADCHNIYEIYSNTRLVVVFSSSLVPYCVNIPQG